MSECSLLYRFAAAVAGVVLLSALTGCSRPEPEQAKTVLVVAARPPEDPAGVAIGVVRSAELHAVAAQNGGRVEKLLVDVGAHVRAGQVLAVFENRAETLKLASATADAARLSAVAEERRHNFKRMDSLMRAAAISQSAFDAAQADARSTEKAAASARDLAALAQRDLDLTQVRSPIDGVVASRPVRLSDTVAPGTVMFEVDGQGPREVVASAPAAAVATLHPGAQLHLRLAGGEGRGVVTEIGERLSANSSRDIRVQIVSGDFAPGSVIEIVLAPDRAKLAGALVPASAVVAPAGAEKSVFVVTSGDRLKRVPVSLRAIGSAGALVDGAVRPGDHVVAAGAAFLTAGMAVKPIATAR